MSFSLNYNSRDAQGNQLKYANELGFVFKTPGDVYFYAIQPKGKVIYDFTPIPDVRLSSMPHRMKATTVIGARDEFLEQCRMRITHTREPSPADAPADIPTVDTALELPRTVVMGGPNIDPECMAYDQALRALAPLDLAARRRFIVWLSARTNTEVV